MSDIKDFLGGKLSIRNFFRSALYRVRMFRADPDWMEPDGIWVFCGPQGSGKTLSAVQAVERLHKKFPKAEVVSNLQLNHIPHTAFSSYDQISDSNGTHGIIFLIDEIHVLWNSLESKNISINEMATFCQMRKDRRIIIGTSQVYSRIAKPIREQLKYCIICKTHFGFLQCNEIVDPAYAKEKDGELIGKSLGKHIWTHSPELYEAYDTYNKIQRIKR